MAKKLRVLEFLRRNKSKVADVAGAIVETAGQITGVELLEKLGELIRGAEDLTEAQKKTAMELLELDVKDRSSARDLQSEALKQTDNFSKRFVYVYASIMSFLAFVYIGYVTFFGFAEEAAQIVYTVVGFLLGSIVAPIITYFFGSSEGSKRKTEIMEKLK